MTRRETYGAMIRCSYFPCKLVQGFPRRVYVVIHFSINVFVRVFGNKHAVDHAVHMLHWVVTLWVFNRVTYGSYGKVLQERFEVFFKPRTIVKQNFAWTLLPA